MVSEISVHDGKEEDMAEQSTAHHMVAKKQKENTCPILYPLLFHLGLQPIGCCHHPHEGGFPPYFISGNTLTDTPGGVFY
jgi:hypothetical protein